MNVLLISPQMPSSRTLPSTPLGLLAVGSYIQKHGYNVRIVDFNVTRKNLSVYLKDFSPDVVGISLIAQTAILHTIELSQYFRNKDIPIVCGGPAVSAIPEPFLKEGVADYVVIGEGEITFHELLQKIEKKEPVGELPGIAYLDECNNLHITPDRPFADLQTFPKLDWSLINPKSYFQHYPCCKKCIYSYQSKGCPGNCTFCFNSFFHRSKHRLRKIDIVCEELRELSENYGVDGVFFGDECFFIRREDLLEFCTKVKALKLPLVWGCQQRVGISKEDLQAMYDSGCRWIFFGVETGSPKVRKSINKHESIEKIEDTYKSCREIGISTTSGTIFGLPGETEEDAQKTIDLYFRLKADTVPAGFFTPMPKSYLWEKLVKDGVISVPNTLSEWANVYYLDNGNAIFGEIPYRELAVIIHFFHYTSFVRSNINGKGSDRFHMIKRYISGINSFFKLHGIFGGLRLFVSGIKDALTMLWYVTAYPKIRKKYGLYLRNFKA